MGNLYIVSTPIGNLQDITLRAVATLQTVDVIACEDTRRTGNLLKILQKEVLPISNTSNNSIKRPQLISYYEQNELRRIPEILSLLQQGKNIALVSDAGTPAISDPGFKLIRTCIEAGIRVEAIPGPSAVISALVVSGLPTDKFLFFGYLPKKDSHKKKILEDLRMTSDHIKTTIILYEAPHRLVETLQLLQEHFGNIPVVVCSELTKLFEETKRGSIEEIIDYYMKKKPKGEFVILFHTTEIKN